MSKTGAQRTQSTPPARQTETHAHDPAGGAGTPGTVSTIRHLQQTAGNGAVSQLLRPSTGPEVPAAAQTVLTSEGQPLDRATQTSMETRFGQDFSQVRVHTGGAAARSARTLGALAYTSGQNIVFGAGQYAPTTGAGQHLLAHELAHVVQGTGQAPRSPSSLPIGPAGDRWEAEAGAAANAVQQRGALRVSTGAPSAIRLTRDPRLNARIEAIERLAAHKELSPEQVASGVMAVLNGMDLNDPDNIGPVLTAIRSLSIEARTALVERMKAASPQPTKPAPAQPTPNNEADVNARREQFEREKKLMQQTPPLPAILFQGTLRPYYRPPAPQITNPILRQQSEVTTGGAFAAGDAQRKIGAVAIAAFGLLTAAAIVAPVAVEVAAGTITAEGIGLTGGRLLLTRGILQGAQSSWVFYLSHPVLINELGLLGVGLLISCEGDVPGLLSAMKEHPEQAAQILLEVWVIHTTVRTSDGATRRATVRAQPLPAEQQTNPKAFQLRVVSAPAVEPAPVTPAPRATPPAPKNNVTPITAARRYKPPTGPDTEPNTQVVPRVHARAEGQDFAQDDSPAPPATSADSPTVAMGDRKKPPAPNTPPPVRSQSPPDETSNPPARTRGQSPAAPPRPPINNAVPPGYEPEPTLRNAYWGADKAGSESNLPAHEFEKGVKGRQGKSLYVQTGDAVFVRQGPEEIAVPQMYQVDGYDPTARELIDRKFKQGGTTSIYDPTNKFRRNVILKPLCEKYIRIVGVTGAKRFVFEVSDPGVAANLNTFFAELPNGHLLSARVVGAPSPGGPGNTGQGGTAK